jgi:hypothetical protein
VSDRRNPAGSRLKDHRHLIAELFGVALFHELDEDREARCSFYDGADGRLVELADNEDLMAGLNTIFDRSRPFLDWVIGTMKRVVG